MGAWIPGIEIDIFEELEEEVKKGIAIGATTGGLILIIMAFGGR